MRWRIVLYIIGILVLFLALMMVIPTFIGLYYMDGANFGHLKAIAISFAAVVFCFLISGKPNIDYLSQREGMAIVAIGWTVIGLFGSLPFYFGDVFTSFTDAFFESVSGFTTTGASVLTNIEIVPKSMLFWRSFIQWLGGMGIIVLSVAILPFLGVGGMQLYKAEVPSPVPDKLKPRIRDTAKILWKVYALISAAQVVLLMFGGMDLFDALCHTFTSMPTGGFSTRNASVASYDNAYIDFIIIFFMLLAGINFSLHYQILKGNTLAFWKDAECRFFLGIVLLLTILVTFNTYGNTYEHLWDAFRYSSFQVVSIVTTTGYATADYEVWPAMSQIIILFSMFLGASAGSTGGGMKCVRIMLCIKYCYKELFSLIHPHAIKHIKICGNTVPEDVIRSILGFLALYMAFFIICTILMTALDVDIVTSLSAVASAIGNIGPGFGSVGPIDNYSQIPATGKWLLIWCMLIGRLEMYTIIILLVPEFWRK